MVTPFGTSCTPTTWCPALKMELLREFWAANFNASNMSFTSAQHDETGVTELLPGDVHYAHDVQLSVWPDTMHSILYSLLYMQGLHVKLSLSKVANIGLLQIHPCTSGACVLHAAQARLQCWRATLHMYICAAVWGRMMTLSLQSFSSNLEIANCSQLLAQCLACTSKW